MLLASIHTSSESFIDPLYSRPSRRSMIHVEFSVECDESIVGCNVYTVVCVYVCVCRPVEVRDDELLDCSLTNGNLFG